LAGDYQIRGTAVVHNRAREFDVGTFSERASATNG
jgi:hypothetical protein